MNLAEAYVIKRLLRQKCGHIRNVHEHSDHYLFTTSIPIEFVESALHARQFNTLEEADEALITLAVNDQLEVGDCFQLEKIYVTE